MYQAAFDDARRLGQTCTLVSRLPSDAWQTTR